MNSEITLAADELFTNAVYNAPHVQFSRNGPGAPRTQEIGNSQDLREAEFFAGSCAKRIVIGCIDHYGSLNPDHILKILMNCYEKGVRGAMNMREGGAGLGTFLLFESALAIYVGVEENRRSVVCCSFSREKRAKVRAALPKNLHICKI